jgi:transketolase
LSSEVDGHNEREILNALAVNSDKPHVILANTRFGSGISFMEGNISWHYLPLTKELYELALQELDDK